jgi:hypothetical protein
MSDLDVVEQLNNDYFRSVQNSDVKCFDRNSRPAILAHVGEAGWKD